MREAALGVYALRLHALLMRVEPKKPDLGVRLQLEKALRLERDLGLPLTEALARVEQECETRVERMLALAAKHGCPLGQGRRDPTATP